MMNLQEKKLHGRPDFPFVVYPGHLPRFATGYPLHWHEEMELICVRSGTGRITVRGQQYDVQEGDLVVIPPRTVHSIQQLEEREMRYFNILFRLSLLEGLPGAAAFLERFRSCGRGIPVLFPRDSETNRALLGVVLELGESRKKEHTDYLLMIYSHLYRILYIIGQECLTSGEKTFRKNASQEKIQEILEYLQEQYAREITVGEAAARCGFSESHFMRLFRENTGTSFSQYVKLQRLNVAAQQLRTTEKRIGEIAEEAGFHNLSYFTRAFAEKYHATPSDYREIWRNKE